MKSKKEKIPEWMEKMQELIDKVIEPPKKSILERLNI